MEVFIMGCGKDAEDYLVHGGLEEDVKGAVEDVGGYVAEFDETIMGTSSFFKAVTDAADIDAKDVGDMLVKSSMLTSFGMGSGLEEAEDYMLHGGFEGDLKNAFNIDDDEDAPETPEATDDEDDREDEARTGDYGKRSLFTGSELGLGATSKQAKSLLRN